MRAWFLSDLHLRGAQDSRSKLLRSFLKRLANLELGEITDLFLVGDIFDLWVGSHKAFSDEYFELLQPLRTLIMSGVKVHYFEGNHDLHLKDYWEKELGVQVYDSPQIFRWDALKVRVEHGDQMNPDDRGYLVLRKTLRTSFVKALVDVLPGAAIKAIGRSMSETSRSWTRMEPTEAATERIRNLIETHVRKVYSEAPFDLLISGHVHVMDDRTFDISGHAVRSVNLGCWPGADRYDRAAAGSKDVPLAFVLTPTSTEWYEIQS